MGVGPRGPPRVLQPQEGAPPPQPHLLDQALQKHRFLAQWVVGEAIAEGDDAVRKVVLRQPGHHAVLLHIRPARYVHDQVAGVLPVPAEWTAVSSIAGGGASHWGEWGGAAPT